VLSVYQKRNAAGSNAEEGESGRAGCVRQGVGDGGVGLGRWVEVRGAISGQ